MWLLFVNIKLLNVIQFSKSTIRQFFLKTLLIEKGRNARRKTRALQVIYEKNEFKIKYCEKVIRLFDIAYLKK